jgi:short-subunit dehydrogenase
MIARAAEVKERRALVTGCSSGIGLAAALTLHQRGWTVIPTARRDADLDMLRGHGLEPIRLDLADSTSVQAAAEEVLVHWHGHIGAIINNAGFGQPGALEDLSREAMRYQFEVNVLGLQELTNRFIPIFRRQGYGRIVNISSVLGRVSLPSMGIYSASKFAVEAISDALRVELRGSGIAVSVIEPGPIATAFGANAVRVGTQNLAPERSVFGEVYRRQLLDPQKRGRREDRFRRSPEVVAKAILHALTSPRPRTRYKVTVPAYAGALAARVAPDRFLDWLMWRRMVNRLRE